MAYEYLEFQKCYDRVTRDKTADVGLSLEDVCLDDAKKHKYANRVDCKEAELSAQESVFAATFRIWWESRYLYRMATLDDIYMKIGFFLMLAYFLRLMFAHRGEVARMEHQFLPYAYNTGDSRVRQWLEWGKQKMVNYEENRRREKQLVVHSTVANAILE